jgi:hypothetical protein
MAWLPVMLAIPVISLCGLVTLGCLAPASTRPTPALRTRTLG